jgi:Domain of unknown function (DUF397)
MTFPLDLSSVTWRKAIRSSGSGNDCVELATVANLVAVRDSKHPDRHTLLFSRSALQQLVEEIRDGHHDR